MSVVSQVVITFHDTKVCKIFHFEKNTSEIYSTIPNQTCYHRITYIVIQLNGLFHESLRLKDNRLNKIE